MYSKIFSEIRTPRLIIRPVTIDDANAYFEAEQASIKELAPHWSWAQTDESVDDVKNFINEAIACNYKDKSNEMNFSLLTQNNKFLGMIWFFEINWFVPHFEIHYWLDSRETGNGYMIEAVNALTRACFDLYKAKRVQIKISSINIKSRKLVEKLNFKQEAEMQNYFLDFVTHEINNGLLFACCDPDILLPLRISISR